MLGIAQECLSMVVRQSGGDSCMNIVRCEAYNALSKYFEATDQKEIAYQYLKNYTQLFDSISKSSVEGFYQVLPTKMHAKYYQRQAYFDNKEQLVELKDLNNCHACSCHWRINTRVKRQISKHQTTKNEQCDGHQNRRTISQNIAT